MSEAFTQQLSLNIHKTNISCQKIDGITLETYEIIVSTFFILAKDSREMLFEQSFLLADIKLDIILGMLFLIMSNADIHFQA